MTESNTLAHIEKIHSTQSGIEDKIYTDENNIRYIGLENGRVKKLDPIEGEITGDHKSSKVEKIGIHTRKKVIDNITQVEINKTDIASLEAKKSDKAFVIAMSMVL